MEIDAYGAPSAGAPLAPMRIVRRAPGPREVLIEIDYCGICHTDIHMVRGEMGRMFPLVPGHEIIGRAMRVGAEVRKFAVGDVVGVGCWVDACRSCAECDSGQEQFCSGAVSTFGGVEKDGVTPTYGGYSTHITVSEDFVLGVAQALDPAAAAPLLCAGITTFSALRHWECGPGRRVGVVGLGGLGHLAVKLGASMGAEVTVLSRSTAKREDAFGLGASDFLATSDPSAFAGRGGQFDLILNTVSGTLDYDAYIRLLARDGTLVLLGVPDGPVAVNALGMLRGRRSIAAAPTGGIAETQELLDYCAATGIGADVEMIPISEVNAAYDRVLASDIRYRFVLDMSSLGSEAEHRDLQGT
jgi:uncharacterized zinc-type alcohol dehydrogenase-like protein